MPEKPYLPISDWRQPSPPTALPYRIRRVVHNKRPNYHSVRGTYYNDATINLISDGKGFYYRQNSKTTVQLGTILIVLPGDDVGVLMADKTDPYDQFCCRFAGTEALKVAKRIIKNRGNGQYAFTWDSWKEGVELFRQMLSTWELNPETIDNERITPAEAMLAQLLAVLDKPDNPSLQKLTAAHLHSYMLDHLHEPMDLDKMAEQFVVSKAHLCRISKKLLGDTIVKIWERMKIDWAKVLLGEASVRVSDVARHVGYHDPFYFSKVFKKIIGDSPKIWQNKI